MTIFSFFNSFYNEKAGKMAPARKVHMKRCNDWKDFCAWLDAQGNKVWESKADAPLISPAVYADECVRRANENVQCWAFVALDIDNGYRDAVSMADALVEMGVNFYLHTSASCGEDLHKYRVFIETDDVIEAGNIAVAWRGLNALFDGQLDPQCKDASRCYYVPGRYKGAEWFAYCETDKAPLCVADLLALGESIPVPATELSYDEIVNFGKPKRTRKLKYDGLMRCDLVRGEYVDAYRNTPTGQHHKALYTFLCKVASRGKAKGVALTVSDLLMIAHDLDTQDGGWYTLQEKQRQCENALRFTGGIK